MVGSLTQISLDPRSSARSAARRMCGCRLLALVRQTDPDLHGVLPLHRDTAATAANRVFVAHLPARRQVRLSAPVAGVSLSLTKSLSQNSGDQSPDQAAPIDP